MRAKGALKHDLAEYVERLDREIKMIQNMKFSGYFLVVWDFIRYAKDMGIPVGPGRGSAAGSLVELRDGDHRHRPAAIRPAVRALPQSRARQLPRHRRGFLHEPPRRGDPVRHAEVRPRAGGADHHVQYAGRARRHQGRGPRAGSAVRGRGAPHQDGAERPSTFRLQEAIDQEPGFNEAAKERPADRRCDEGGAAPGRAGAQLLGTCRRRGDLAAAAAATWFRCTRPTATKLSPSSTWAAWRNSSCSRWISWG